MGKRPSARKHNSDPRERIRENVQTFLERWDKTYPRPWSGPYKYQYPLIVEIVYRALSGKGGTITALFPRQSGKSDALGMALFYLVVLSAIGGTPRPLKIGIFAPKEGQALLLMRKIKNRLVAIEPELKRYRALPVKDLERWSEWLNGTLIKTISAKPTAQVVGESFNLMVLDESQDIEDEIKANRIDPMGAHYDALRVLVGTPGFSPNFFYRALSDESEDVVHFRASIEEVISENPNYERYLRRQESELGRDSPAFRRQYLLEWLFNIGQPITVRDIERMRSVGLEKVLDYYDGPVWVGIDLAKYEDSTVAVAVVEDEKDENRAQIIGILELGHIGYKEQFDELLLWMRRYPGIQKVVIDATGVGDPVLEWFSSARPDIPFEPFKFSAPAKDALYKEYLRAIEEGRLGLPRSAPPYRPTPNASATEDETLRRFSFQNIALVREYKNGLLSIHHPAGGHDDYPDATALALWGFLKRGPTASAHILHIPSASKDSLSSMSSGKFSI